jgi:hypothetical protein
MDLQLLPDADKILSKCGRPLRLSHEGVFLPVPMRFPFQANHQPSTEQTEERQIFGQTVFMLRSISIVPPINQLYWRLQFPSGRYLHNVNRVISQVANTASQRYVLDREVVCEPGSSLIVTLDDRPAYNGAGAPSVTPVNIMLGGVYLFHLVGSTVQPINPLRDAALLKRYFDTPNQNILAPEIALSLKTENTPAGRVDTGFTYTDPGTVNPGFVIQSQGRLSQSRNVLISGTSNFCVRRLRFTLTPSDPALSGTLLVRVRDASGYSLTNDYIEISQFSNSPYACDWILCGGTNLIFDYSVVDVAGSASDRYFNVQCFIEGVRRK